MKEPDGRVQRGRSIYARNFGVDEATIQEAMEGQMGALFVHELFATAGGPGWNGDALTDRDRAVAAVTVMVAQGVTDHRLAAYAALARHNGIDEAGLTQLLILLTAFLGQPAAVQAMAAIREQGAPTT